MKEQKCIYDAILQVLNSIYSHLEKPGTCIRLMFYDFSSAFKIIQPQLLSEKLLTMNVQAFTMWILDYLTNHLQFVKVQSERKSCSHHQPPATEQNFISDVVCTNTRTPLGTVLSPFLFSLYTTVEDSRSSNVDCMINKYADVTVLIGQITDDDDTYYRQEIDSFVRWCDQNHLELNVGKTNKNLMEFRKKKCLIPSSLIKS